MWQKLAFFVGGLAIGGAAGYFAAKYLIEDKALKETEKQVSEIKDYYEARLKSTEKAAELNELKRKYAENKIAERSDAPTDYTKHFTGGKPVDIQPNPVAKPEDYSEDDEWGDAKRPKGAPKKAKYDEKTEPYFEDPDGPIIYPTDTESEPQLISEQSFTDDMYEFEKMTLFWFMGDNVVTDEEFQPIEDMSLIGVEWQQHFGEEDDPDVVHVRNRKIGCDYEIIRDKRSYATTIPE